MSASALVSLFVAGINRNINIRQDVFKIPIKTNYSCRFEFPEEIDMYKYTVTGLEEREANEAAAAARNLENPDRPPSRLGTEQATSQRDTAQSKYYLKGIVVHSGTAFAGHYYSYIKASLSVTFMAHLLL